MGDEKKAPVELHMVHVPPNVQIGDLAGKIHTMAEQCCATTRRKMKVIVLVFEEAHGGYDAGIASSLSRLESCVAMSKVVQEELGIPSDSAAVMVSPGSRAAN